MKCGYCKNEIDDEKIKAHHYDIESYDIESYASIIKCPNCGNLISIDK